MFNICIKIKYLLFFSTKCVQICKTKYYELYINSNIYKLNIMRANLKSVKLQQPKESASSVRKLEYLRVLAILDSKGIKVQFTEDKITSLKKRFISKLKLK